MDARVLARRLLGGDRIGGWALTDARRSSGLRLTLTPSSGDGARTFVLLPPGAPAFLTTQRLAIALLGVTHDDSERLLLRELAARLRVHEASFAAGELEALLADAALGLAPPLADAPAAARPLRRHEAELRLNLVCNQRCFFCNCDGSTPNVVATRAAAVAAVERLVRDGADSITLTGGEPTQNVALDDVARAARAAGARHVMVQTNALTLAEGGRAQTLRDAGVDALFVSLHSLEPDLSDWITAAPGTHAATLRGIDAALAAGLSVITNFVINRYNLDEPPAYVRGLRARWPQLAGRVFSFMSPVGAALRHLDQLPRISDALPSLRTALDDCRAAGEWVRVAGVCGLPLCTLRGYESLCDELANPPGVALAPDRVKPASCATCRWEARCSGVWRRYVELHGADEFVPLADAAGGGATEAPR